MSFLSLVRASRLAQYVVFLGLFRFSGLPGLRHLRGAPLLVAASFLHDSLYASVLIYPLIYPLPHPYLFGCIPWLAPEPDWNYISHGLPSPSCAHQPPHSLSAHHPSAAHQHDPPLPARPLHPLPLHRSLPRPRLPQLQRPEPRQRGPVQDRARVAVVQGPQGQAQPGHARAAVRQAGQDRVELIHARDGEPPQPGARREEAQEGAPGVGVGAGLEGELGRRAGRAV